MSDNYEHLCGWAGPDEAQLAWNTLMAAQEELGHVAVGYNFLPETVFAAPPGPPEKRVALWDATRKVLGKDTPNYPQEVGDCVSFGSKNATEYLEAQEIIAGDREEHHLVYPPYLYGTSRVQIGRGRLRGDGSTGAWAAAAVMKYGILRADLDGCPAYSGSVARQWGASGPPAKFLAEGSLHIVKTAAQINSIDGAVAALRSYYPLTIASNRGFTMEARSDGFHAPSGSWSHQMSVVFYADDPEPHVGILNSWGDVHGHLKDLVTGEDWPVGMIRARLEVLGSMIQGGECFAYSQFDGFPAKRPDYSVV